MAQQHVATAQQAIETLTAVRRELTEKLAATGQRTNVWEQFRDVQLTIESLKRARDDERERLSIGR